MAKGKFLLILISVIPSNCLCTRSQRRENIFGVNTQISNTILKTTQTPKTLIKRKTNGLHNLIRFPCVNSFFICNFLQQRKPVLPMSILVNPAGVNAFH